MGCFKKLDVDSSEGITDADNTRHHMGLRSTAVPLLWPQNTDEARNSVEQHSSHDVAAQLINCWRTHTRVTLINCGQH